MAYHAMYVRHIIDLMQASGMADVNTVIWHFYRRLCIRHHDAVAQPTLFGIEVSDSIYGPYLQTPVINRIIRSLCNSYDALLQPAKEWALENKHRYTYFMLVDLVISGNTVTFTLYGDNERNARPAYAHGELTVQLLEY